jgi:uncharacterized protein YndB with AHSA1/START domain
MDVSIDDAGFVRAPVDLVYRRLTAIDRWPQWWQQTDVRVLPPSDGSQRWGVGLMTGPAFRLRYGLTVDRWRHEAGFSFRMDGDVSGRGEFWLEPVASGTVVHHLVVATTPLRRTRRVVGGYRRSVRRGLWGLKDALQLEARTSAGVTP